MHLWPRYVHKIDIAQIRVFTPALSLPALTRMYYKELTVYNDHVDGPAMTNSLMDAPAELMISAYGKQTYNFVPPLMLQERFDAKACDGFASDTATVFTSQGMRKCIGYKCTGAEQRAIQCSSKANADAKSVPAPYFGRESQKYRDEYVFAEFLHTFSSKLIFR